MSFLFPAYLLGLVGVLLPWMLHRFSDQNPEEQLFPSDKFLEETKPPTSRARRLKYKILMAIRMLSVLLLCFLFAQPWLDNDADENDVQMHHIIAVDLSLSMRADDRWEIALQKAGELIDRFADNTSVELVGFDKSLSRIADNSISKTDLVQGLAEMQPGYVSADYGVLMQRLNRLAIERLEPVKVWIITDEQRSSMPSQHNTLFAPEVFGIEIVSTVIASQRNVHLRASARSDDGVNVRLWVQLTASESEPAQEVAADASGELITSTVTVRFGDKVIAQRSVGIAPRGVESVAFDSFVMPPGDAPLVTVSLEEEDAVESDNTVPIIIRQANPSIVASLRSDSAASTDAFVFVSTALETDSQASVVTVSGAAGQIAPAVLHLVSGRDLSQDRLDPDIRQFVDEGKNALIFSSSKTFNTETPLIQGVEVGLVDESHPLALGDIKWFGTEFYDVPELSLLEGDRVLLETTQRHPVLVERQVPNGRILLLNDRLDGHTSNLPFQPAFVELMKSVIDYFDTSSAVPEQLTAGERLPVSGNVQVMDPANNPMLSLDESTRLAGVVLNAPGLYTVIGQRGAHKVQVLLDPAEADLTQVSQSALSNWRKRFDHKQAVAMNDSNKESVEDRPAIMESQVQRSSARLWLWLLPALAGALLIETLLANRRLNVSRDGS